MKLRTLFAFLFSIVAGLQQVKAQEAYACYTSSNSTLTFYFDKQRSSRAGKTFDLVNTDPPEWCFQVVTTVQFDPSFAGARPTTTRKWFYGMSALQSIVGLPYLNTSEVTDMYQMFCDCQQLTSLDLSSFNTSKVEDMSEMFCDCEALQNLNLSSFDTSNVENMSGMFERCEALTSLDLSNFNTANVTNMYCMFMMCGDLTSLDVSHFNTKNVEKMSSMFERCYSLSILDLSNWDTSNLTETNFMFAYCYSLTTIIVGDGWNMDKVVPSDFNGHPSGDMFYNSNNLVGGKGTTYDDYHTDSSYAHIDGGPDNPGYFTASDKPTTYDLWIAGTQVTKQNKNDILGDGKVTFDVNTSTLTLQNANISLSGNDGITSKVPDLKIKVLGQNSITTTYSGRGVSIDNDSGDGCVTFLGDGSLNIKSQRGNGIRSNIDVVLKDGVKIITESKQNSSIRGWKSTTSAPWPSLTMYGDKTILIAKGSVGSFHSLNLNDGLSITRPAGARYVADDGVYVGSNKVADEWVVIGDLVPGDANLDGVVDIADVVAVLNAMANDSNAPQFNVNGDSAVDIADVVAVLNIMAEQ